MPDISGKSRIIHSVQQDLEDLENQANQARGSDIYVIRALSSLVSSLFRLETSIDKNRDETIQAVNNLTKTIKELDNKNTKLQKTGLWLAVVATIFTVAQVVQVIEIIRKWVGY
jgi:hypothetical protein